jgi:nitroreductase
MLNKVELNLLWNEARSYSHWQDKSVSTTQLEELYNLLKFAPTAANSCPARFVFIKSEASKQKLKKSLAEGNIEKSMSAPVVAIIAYDTEFHYHLPFLFPHTDAKSWYEGNDAKIKESATMNATLQAAYLILAARSLGLDCGPMSGFDNAVLDAEFFADGKYKSLLICGLGYGDKSGLYPRSPRFEFDKVCKIV